MQTFFSSFAAIEAFTRSLNLNTSDKTCKHCNQNDQWVSHGNVKKLGKHPIGKRIFCSNRHNKTGCGRTQQLYIDTVIPGKHYSTTQLTAFIVQLLYGLWVEDAYRLAVDACDARQAWRWINALFSHLGSFRSQVKHPLSDNEWHCRHRSDRLHHLLPTLKQLFEEGWSFSAQQYKQQHAIF